MHLNPTPFDQKRREMLAEWERFLRHDQPSNSDIKAEAFATAAAMVQMAGLLAETAMAVRTGKGRVA